VAVPSPGLLTEHKPIRLIPVHNQDPKALQVNRQNRLGRLTVLELHLQGSRKGKCGPFAFFTLCPDRTAHRLGKLLGDSQAQT